MLRPRFGGDGLSIGLILCAAIAATASAPTRADQAFQSQSTLDFHVAQQDLGLDATISSMVRRGLLADIDANAAALKPAPPVAWPKKTTPAVAPSIPPASAAIRTPGPTMNHNSGWRAAGRRSSGGSQPTPRVATSQPNASLRPHANAAYGRTPNPALSSPAPVPIPGPAPRQAPAPRAVQPPVQPPARPAPLTIAVEAAAKPIESAPLLAPAMPSTSPSDDHLAPIDELSETPAPSHDAPGDPREPEIGDEQLEGALTAKARKPDLECGEPAPDAAVTPTLPERSSVAGSQLRAVGEPDRIARNSDGPAPEDPESYEEADEVEPQPKVVASTTPTAPTRPLTRNQKMLRDKIRRVLKHYYNHPLNTGDRSPWEVMHQMLAFEVHSRIRQDGPAGQPITAVGWLCFNRPCKGRTLMYLSEEGDLRVKVGPALQGHNGQLLALLAQARVRFDYPLQVDGKDFTVVDLIEAEKSTCYPRTELTFKLLGLQRYLDLEAHWMNDQGMAWDFPTLLDEEMKQPVRTAACGGCHRLSGLILTAKKRARSGQPLDGKYAEAARFVANYQNYAYRLQNPDGSFSTEWFKGPGAEEDIDRRLKTTGHQLEFLIYAANEQQLSYYRTVKAVNYLSNIMWANRDREWEAGPLGHAIHALVLYDRFVFAPYDAAPANGSPVARRPSHVVR